MKFCIRRVTTPARALARMTALVVAPCLAVFGRALPVHAGPPASTQAADSDLGPLAAQVDPFIGNAMNGYTSPGATRPFAMVSFGPALAKRQKSDYLWNGFELVHSSGAVGMSHRAMAFSVLSGEVPPQADLLQRLSEEVAHPGYYRGRTMPADVVVELTSTTRCGLARLRPPADKGVTLLFADEVQMVDVRRITNEPGALSGRSYRSLTWDTDPVAMGLRTDREVQPASLAQLQGRKQKAVWVRFAPGKTVQVKIGLSYRDAQGAAANLASEIPGWDFEAVRKDAAREWETFLNRITVEGGTAQERARFATAMYHAQLMPCMFSDVDGRYMGYRLAEGQSRITDKGINTRAGTVPEVAEKGRSVYSTFSGWDIYRTQWPLLCLIQRERAGDMAMSMVLIQEQAGFLARWPVINSPSLNMQGMALTHMLATAARYQVPSLDLPRILKAVLADASFPNAAESRVLPRGKDALMDAPGWIPGNVSVTLECAHGFAAIADLAAIAGDAPIARINQARAQAYRRSYDAESGEFRSRDLAGAWVPGGYCEGNAANYRWLVPHDVPGLIALLGGEQKFLERLDAYRRKGFSGRNEHDFHAPFLYNFAGEPFKTQEWVRKYIAEAYLTKAPRGMPDDDDCGTMSAYYIFASLGLYPLDPSSGTLLLTSPVFTRARIAVGDGKTFTIEAPDASEANRYIQAVRLNGRPHEYSSISADDILAGGVLSIDLGPTPSKWATAPEHRPKSKLWAPN